MIRNDQLLIDQEEKKEESSGQAVQVDKFGPIRSLLMSPIGILIFSALIGWKILFTYNKLLMLGRTESAPAHPHSA